jgi:hypothetical protein
MRGAAAAKAAGSVSCRRSSRVVPPSSSFRYSGDSFETARTSGADIGISTVGGSIVIP